MHINPKRLKKRIREEKEIEAIANDLFDFIKNNPDAKSITIHFTESEPITEPKNSYEVLAGVPMRL